MNQQRVLVYIDSLGDVDFFDVSSLTDVEVLRLAAIESDQPVAYGTLHFFEGGARTVSDLFMCVELGPEKLAHGDLSWAEKVVAAMPEDEEWQREYKARYQKRLEELRR